MIRALRCTCGRHIVVEVQEDIYVTEVFDYKCQKVYRLQENIRIMDRQVFPTSELLYILTMMRYFKANTPSCLVGRYRNSVKQ